MAETTGKVYPVHNNVFKFGIKGLASTDVDMMMPKDLENFAPSIDGTVEEWFAMDAGGWSKAAMTGKKLSFSFKGKRSVGDPGNDYIAGLAWKFGQDVMTKFEWTMVSGAKLACDVVVNVKTPGGGDTTNIDSLEFDVQCYGKPDFTDAPAA
ncbi:phage tail tube protein [Oribacterium sp. HCP28S3_H8]|uniref:phage tail tube protein n=1 Tax=Oribacterium sp. HCP28S3_H8 TaxID=3438945 RepID=UPI003F89F547